MADSAQNNHVFTAIMAQHLRRRHGRKSAQLRQVDPVLPRLSHSDWVLGIMRILSENAPHFPIPMPYSRVRILFTPQSQCPTAKVESAPCPNPSISQPSLHAILCLIAILDRSAGFPQEQIQGAIDRRSVLDFWVRFVVEFYGLIPNETDADYLSWHKRKRGKKGEELIGGHWSRPRRLLLFNVLMFSWKTG